MAKWLFDPGHGGSDSGATYKGRRESDDVLRMAKRVAEIMKANGESIDFTRTTDATVSLRARSNKENNGSYNYFVSFHRNAFEPEKAHGVETHVYSKNGGKAEQLANKVNPLLVDCGFLNRGVKASNFHVLRETKCPSILIEMGFIDHTTDNNIFSNKFESIAQAIAKGCLKQIGKNLNSTGGSSSSSSSSSSSDSFKIGDYGKAVVVTADSLNVRSGRGTEHEVIGSLSKGQKVTINYILPDNRDGKGDSALWGSFDFKNTTGYIHLGYVKPV